MTLENIWNDDTKLRRVFSWLTRIGAAPKFGSRPIGWYQQHQCAAIDWLKENCGERALLRVHRGQIQMQSDIRRWINVCPPNTLYDIADNACRTNKQPAWQTVTSNHIQQPSVKEI